MRFSDPSTSCSTDREARRADPGLMAVASDRACRACSGRATRPLDRRRGKWLSWLDEPKRMQERISELSEFAPTR